MLPILVMGYTDPTRVPAAISAGIQLAVYQQETAQQYAAQARSAGSRLRVHAKLDTGMGRLGVFAEEGPAFISALTACKELDVAGVFTHFARADEPDQPSTDRQIDRFSKAVAELESAGLRPPLVHASNSAACLYHPKAWFDVVRPGVAIYGLHPSPAAPLPEGFRAALSWKARLVSVKDLPPESGVSYGHRYVTRKTERIGAIPVGYADGFRRQGGNSVLVGGQRIPVAGTVCMDQCMVQLDAVPQARPGDEVVLIGRQGDAVITAEDIGRAWGTINYEVVCGLAARLPRIYL
jgi:alanine racemase